MGRSEQEYKALEQELAISHAETKKWFLKNLNTEARLSISQKWSSRWKKLAQFRGWPSSEHEANRHRLARVVKKIEQGVGAGLIAPAVRWILLTAAGGKP